MALYVYSDLKAILELDGTVITDYPGLEVIADGVEARIESHLGRFLPNISREKTFYIKRRTKLLPLEALPINSVDSITYNGVAYTNYDKDTYGLQLRTNVISGVFVVTYTGGLGTAPEWLRRALNQQIIYEWQNREHMGAENVVNDGGSVSTPELELLKDVVKILAYERHAITRLN